VRESPRAVQVILTTHSPNLASAIPLENLLMLDGGRAYSLRAGETKLSTSDYRFLERFLDVTKANLFFAHGVVIVEGDAEALLLPTLARLLGADLTEHGVSVVNVGGTGLRRFSRIFQRSRDTSPSVSVPVACITDMDVMPDCAPSILGLVTGDEDDEWESSKRRWKATRDFGGEDRSAEEALTERRKHLRASDGQSVHTFVADHWTLEYDLAFCGLAEEVYVAACLAKNDAAIMEEKKTITDVEAAARTEFGRLSESAGEDRAVLCSHIYKLFHSTSASKAIAAQYLANSLNAEGKTEGFDAVAFERRLPRYVVAAIAHATGAALPRQPADGGAPVESTDG
jgi:putative ATP-dependent endonuclease of OLD family